MTVEQPGRQEIKSVINKYLNYLSELLLEKSGKRRQVKAINSDDLTNIFSQSFASVEESLSTWKDPEYVQIMSSVIVDLSNDAYKTLRLILPLAEDRTKHGSVTKLEEVLTKVKNRYFVFLREFDYNLKNYLYKSFRTKTYWKGERGLPDQLANSGVDFPYGDSGNEFLDAYMAASGIYYEMYNNGGTNINMDRLLGNIDSANYNLRRLKPILKYLPVSVSKHLTVNNQHDLDDYESWISKEKDNVYYNAEALFYFVTEVVKDKDLSYKEYRLWFNNKERKISHKYHEGWSDIVFGSIEQRDSWIEARTGSIGDKLID